MDCTNSERLVGYCILMGGCTAGVLGEGITLQQSWKENTGNSPRISTMNIYKYCHMDLNNEQFVGEYFFY